MPQATMPASKALIATSLGVAAWQALHAWTLSLTHLQLLLPLPSWKYFSDMDSVTLLFWTMIQSSLALAARIWICSKLINTSFRLELQPYAHGEGHRPKNHVQWIRLHKGGTWGSPAPAMHGTPQRGHLAQFSCCWPGVCISYWLFQQIALGAHTLTQCCHVLF